MRILLVDDHAVVRGGMRHILQDICDDAEFGEAANADEALAQVLAQDWDIVFLDIRLPGRSGVDVLGQIRAHKPKLPVLVLSTYPESQYAVRLIRAGASGYLTKDADEEEIATAVQQAMSGHKYISQGVGELLAGQMDQSTGNEETPSHEKLSDREYQIFLGLAAGTRPIDLGKNLNVSAKTIATHRARILQKMGFANNAELILYAHRHNLGQE